jgi:hypothetical protein
MTISGDVGEMVLWDGIINLLHSVPDIFKPMVLVILIVIQILIVLIISSFVVGVLTSIVAGINKRLQK